MKTLTKITQPVRGPMPDITPATIGAAIAAVLAQLANAQLVSGQTQHLIVGIAGIVLPFAWIAFDYLNRIFRNKRKAAEAAAAAPAPARMLVGAREHPQREVVREAVREAADRALGSIAPASDARASDLNTGAKLAFAGETTHVGRSLRPVKQPHPMLKAYGTFEGLRLGKQPARHDPRTLMLAAYLTAGPKIKVPTRVSRSPMIGQLLGGDFGMMGNDAHGDCTCAALGHAVQFWTGVHGQPVSPTTGQVLDLYWRTGNPTTPGADDNGRVMFEVLKYAHANGMFGRELGAYVAVGIRRYRHRDVKAAIDILGGAYIGVALPETAQTQAEWDVTGDPHAAGPAQAGSWGGHAIELVDYDSAGPTCITWGHPLKMTWRFLDAYCDEAYAMIAPDWLSGGKTIEGLDLAMLEADLAALRSGWQPQE